MVPARNIHHHRDNTPKLPCRSPVVIFPKRDNVIVQQDIPLRRRAAGEGRP
jgi:hypothetical protein